VLCGSTNEDCWLHDPTGGRRFIPVTVGTIDLDWLRSNRGQLFAEAVVLYKAGRKWWYYPRAATLAEQEARAADDPWTDAVRKYLCGRPEVDASEILSHVLQIPTERQNKGHSTRAGIVLKRLGCKAQARRRIGGVLRRMWVVPAEFAAQPLSVPGPVQSAPIESHFDLVGGAS
jgi:putative DNA primase/helicase